MILKKKPILCVFKTKFIYKDINFIYSSDLHWTLRFDCTKLLLYITDYTAYSISNCLSNILKPNAFTEENVPDCDPK